MPRRLAAVLVAAMAAATPAALHAQSTTPPQLFFACYVPSSGTGYRINEADLEQECIKTTHIEFSWTDGAQAVRQITRVDGEVRTIAANENGEAIAFCPAGTQLTGGGYRFVAFSNAGLPVVFESAPLISSSLPPGWRPGIHNGVPGAIDVKVRAVALCARSRPKWGAGSIFEGAGRPRRRTAAAHVEPRASSLPSNAQTA